MAACLFVAGSILRLPGWIAPVPAVLAIVIQAHRLPSALERIVRRLLMAVLAALLVVGFIQTLYPVLPPEQIHSALRWLTLTLAALTALLCFGAGVLSHARVLLPAGTGLLLAAALCVSGEARRLEIPPLMPVPLLALVAYLFLNSETLTPVGARGLTRRRLLRLALSAVVALTAALGVARLLPWAAPLVERLFADGRTAGTSGFSENSRLGDIESLALDHSVALRVWTNEPRYLRLRVATRFSANSWHADSDLAARLPAQPLTAPEPPAFSDCVANVPGTTVAIVSGAALPMHFACARVLPAQSLATDALPTASGLLLLRTSSERIEVDGAGVAFARSASDREMLGFAAWPAGAPPAIAEPPGLLAACLTLPASLDARTRDLAERIAHSAPRPADRVEATVHELQSRCHYALDVGRFRSSDAISEFLFEKQRGYCEYFASAAVLLLRLQGVPARYVTGFSTRASAFEAGHYVVRMSDAHAWVEAYVDGAWREVDPTPPAEYDLLHRQESSWWSAAWESVQATWLWLTSAIRQSLRSGDLLWIGRRCVAALRFLFVDHYLATAMALLLLIATRLPIWRRSSRRRTFAPPRPLDTSQIALREVFARLDQLLERRGLSRPRSRPPLEHLRALPASALDPELRALAADVVNALYAALFAGTPPAAAAVEDLRQRVDAANAQCEQRPSAHHPSAVR
jgi:hypothetical protein